MNEIDSVVFFILFYILISIRDPFKESNILNRFCKIIKSISLFIYGTIDRYSLRKTQKIKII